MDEENNESSAVYTNPTTAPNSIDDKPVGGSKYTFSEYPDGDSYLNAKRSTLRNSNLKNQGKI